MSLQGANAIEDVIHLGFDDEQRRGVADPGVRSGDDEQVGKIGQGGAEVGPWVLRPDLLETGAFFARYRVGNHPVGGIVASGPDDQVQVDVLAVQCHDTGLVDGRDALLAAVQRHVVARQCRVQRAGQNHPFAADGVVRRQLAPQFGIRHLAFEKTQGLALDHVHRRFRILEGNHPGFELPVDPPAQQLVGRLEPQQPALETAKAAVSPGQDPVGRALEYMQVPDVRGDGRNDLGRTGAAADDGHAFLPVVVVMIPVVGVKRFTLKTLLSVEARNNRLTQRPGRVDQELRAKRAFAGGVHRPAFVGVVPFDALDIGAQFHFVPQAEVLHHVAGVAVQFGLFGEHLRPAIRSKRQGVQRRGHVDCRAGVGVLAPGAAEEIPPLQQAKIVDAGLEQIDCCTLAAKPAADDQYLKGLHGPPLMVIDQPLLSCIAVNGVRLLLLCEPDVAIFSPLVGDGYLMPP
ncbi:hypothetical protein D3C72_866850 [compost metagenome]